MASFLLVSSPISPRCSFSPTSSKLSLTHFNKHLAGTSSRQPIQTHETSRNALTPLRLPISSIKTKPHMLRCSSSSGSSSVPDKNLSFDSLSATISQFSPLAFWKWYLVFAAGFLGVNYVLLNPFFWMYFSWLWLFWPWYVATGLVVYGVYGLYKQFNGGANEIEQVGVIASVLTWTTICPQAIVNGYFDGWPLVYFYVYLLFFVFLNAAIRKHFYGNLYPLRVREPDPKWDCNLSIWSRGLFCGALFVAHWLAAFETPRLPATTAGWLNIKWIWVLILTSFVVNGHSMWYIAKFSQKMVIPTGIARFGVYRWLRHPMYASTMLLLATYFIALQAPRSLMFVVASCVVYYEQKTKLEEAMMLESFGKMDSSPSKYLSVGGAEGNPGRRPYSSLPPPYTTSAENQVSDCCLSIISKRADWMF